MWKPIEKYDKLKKKPKECVFYFPDTRSGRNCLLEIVKNTRHFGSRVCTHYYEVGTPKGSPTSSSQVIQSDDFEIRDQAHEMCAGARDALGRLSN